MASLMGSLRLKRWGGFATLLGVALAAALTLFPAYHIDGLGSSPPGEYLRVFLPGFTTLLLAAHLSGPSCDPVWASLPRVGHNACCRFFLRQGGIV
jgi:hypothetical protein